MILPALTCRQCGQPEAHDLGDETLCAACIHERGACGAIAHPEETELPALPSPETASAVFPPAPDGGERLRLNPNCCYQACAACRSLGRLREFRARFPHDWASRLGGSEPLRQRARESC